MRLVLVKWVDACGGILEGWRPLPDIKKAIDGVNAESVGWLLRENQKMVVVCPHRTFDDEGTPDAGDGEIRIPKDWVTEIIDLIPNKEKE